jgi:hypothetical protein
MTATTIYSRPFYSYIQAWDTNAYQASQAYLHMSIEHPYASPSYNINIHSLN